MFLRDEITRQLELAAVATDPAERDARCTFVVVSAGYTGTEVVAQGQLLTTRLAKKDARPRQPADPVDAARHRAPAATRTRSSACPKTADRVLRRRGVKCARTGQSVTKAMSGLRHLVDRGDGSDQDA